MVTLLVEKYRPRVIEDLVLKDKKKLLNFINNVDLMPNLLLFDESGGTGKNSIFNVIKNSFPEDKVIKVNCCDVNNVDFIRKNIKNIILNRTISGSKGRRLIYFDEVNDLPEKAIHNLKPLLEEYSDYAVFILSTNHYKKIPEPIKSRCFEMDLSNPIRQEIYERLKFICEEENIQYNENSLYNLISLKYPNIRSMVNEVQSSINIDEFNLPESTAQSSAKLCWRYIKKNKVDSIRKYYTKNELDLNELFVEIYEYCNFNKFNQQNSIRELFFRYERDIVKSKKPTIIFDKFLFELGNLLDSEPKNSENDTD